MTEALPAIKEVAIIGAGLAGLALAIALHQQSIKCRIYEKYDADYTVVKSSVAVSPNGCRVLAALGLYDRLKDQGYHLEESVFKNENHETIDCFWYGHEKLYGYKCLRIYRERIIKELQQACAEASIPIEYRSEFTGVVEDTTDGVTFLINNTQKKADMLVGSDGINSTVRDHIAKVEPQYAGNLALYVDIPTATPHWPTADYPKACTLLGKAGALLMMPCTPDASTLVAIRQFQQPDMTRDEWSALARDKDRLAEMILRNRDSFNDLGRSILDAMAANKHDIALWNYKMIPKLPAWSSPSGRVLVIGDAAHAIPPSSAQGVNQAFEDAYSLTLLLGRPAAWTASSALLGAWHAWRQARIDQLMLIVKVMNAKRLPEPERQKMAAAGLIKDNRNVEESEEELRWLYAPNLKEEMDRIVSEFGAG